MGHIGVVAMSGRGWGWFGGRGGGRVLAEVKSLERDEGGGRGAFSMCLRCLIEERTGKWRF